MRVAAAAPRRGFTLVELLIVLAIISVLAGLLFPVFVAARAAAQKVKCLSNFKNVSLATILYAQDYNDQLMPINHRPGLAPDPAADLTWPQLLFPYAHDFRLYDCPAETNPMEFGGSFDEDLQPGNPSARYFDAALHSDIGYNAYYLSPVFRDGEAWFAAPRTMSGINPRTLLFAESRAEGGGSYLVSPPCRYIVDHNQWKDTFTGTMGNPFEEDAVYTPIRGWDVSGRQSPTPQGGVGVRHSDRLNVARLDGGARSVKIETLTEGCQVRSQWLGSITDMALNPWSPAE